MVKVMTAIAALLLTASAAWAATAFEDLNCNGVFDSDDIEIILDAPPEPISILSENCLVFPRGLDTKARVFVYISGFEKVTVGAHLTADLKDDQAAMWIKGKELTILPGTRISSGGDMYLGANDGLLVIGDNTRFVSTKAYADLVSYGAAGLVVGKGVVMRAFYRAELSAPFGPVIVSRGLNVHVAEEFGVFKSDGGTGIKLSNAAIIEANIVEINTPATPIEFRGNKLKLFTPGWGYVSVNSSYFDGVRIKGPVDMTGTQFLDNQDVFVTGDPITGF